ncbi:MAG TPA: PadR family transcriptional regulator [Candidatus Cloacimonadota bacterium]|nr:PadR family transcriptional regulator [Candidatus Cloacimonadota bacterium]
MREITNAEAALLGLLSEGARHPYQLEKDVQYRDMRSWTDLSISSIYKLLRQLEVESLVDLSRDLMDNNRMRKVYSITDLGRKALARKITNLVSDAEHVKWDSDVAFYNFNNIPKAERRALLEAHIRSMEEQIKCYQELEEFMGNDGCPAWHRAVSRRPQFIWKAEIDWTRDFIKELEEKKEI